MEITYFIKFRQWDGEKYTDWIHCYTKSNPFTIFQSPKYQVSILWHK